MAAKITTRNALPATGESEGKRVGLQQITVTSNEDEGKTVDLSTGTYEFKYYESILQDVVQCSISYGDTGDTIDKKTAMEGLPIIGQEKVDLEFEDNVENKIKMTLYVNKVTPLMDDTRKSSVNLNLASREMIMNEKKRVVTRFDGKIHEHVEKILKDQKYLGTNQEVDIEKTQNSYNFVGNNKKPFYLLNWLSKVSVPDLGSTPGTTAGFLFWETNKGFKFKSLDWLLDKDRNPIKKSIIYNETSDMGNESMPEGYDIKALEYSVDNKVNIHGKLKMGAYSTRTILFNPFDNYFEIVNPLAKANESQYKMSGQKLPVLNKEFDIKGKNADFTRTAYFLTDTGALPEGTGRGKKQEQLKRSKNPNLRPESWVSQGNMRLNQLFAQTTTITIPGDFSLSAGDCIFVDAPELTDETCGSKADDVDKQTGGVYIISDICHFISPQNTLTQMNLIRDSVGRKGKPTDSVGQGGSVDRPEGAMRTVAGIADWLTNNRWDLDKRGG